MPATWRKAGLCVPVEASPDDSNRAESTKAGGRLMAMKFYETPFHVTHPAEVANRMAEQVDNEFRLSVAKDFEATAKAGSVELPGNIDSPEAFTSWLQENDSD